MTFGLGQAIGAALRAGDVLALVGGIGAGKTCLAKGIAAGAGVPDEEYVTSPAYDIAHEYPGRLKLVHIDFYRLSELSQDELLWLDEYVHGGAACMIEWADKFIAKLAASYLTITMTPGPSESERDISVDQVGDSHGHLLRAAQAYVDTLSR